MKKCPYCAEEIKDEAIKCKHCEESLEKQSHKAGDSRKPLYDKWWGLLLFLFIWPFYLIWFIWSQWNASKTRKWIATGGVILLLIIGLGMSGSSESGSQNSPYTNKLQQQNTEQIQTTAQSTSSSDSQQEGSEPSQASQTTEDETSQPSVNPVDYQILKVKDISTSIENKPISSYSKSDLAKLPTAKREKVFVGVPEDITRKQIRPTVRQIINKKKQNNPDLDALSLLIYPGDSIASQFIAKAEWAPGGDFANLTEKIARSNDRGNYEISLDIKNNLEKFLKRRRQNEERFGLSEKERREVYKKVSEAEMRAMNKADRMYSLEEASPSEIKEVSERNSQAFERLYNKFKKNIREEYGLSKRQLEKIMGEGYREGWSG